MNGWKSYIGLPHVFGADPENGEGADCLVMVFRVLDELGIAHPAFDPAWVDLARASDWRTLRRLWRAGTEPCAPEDGAMTLFTNPGTGLGIAVVVDAGLLMVTHHRGVSWVPLHQLKPMKYRRIPT